LDDRIERFILLRDSSIKKAIKQSGLTGTSGLSLKHPIRTIKTFQGRFKSTRVEITKGKHPKAIGKEFMNFAIRSIIGKLRDVEKARKAYREHCTITRQGADNLSESADKLMKKMRSAKTLNEERKIVSKCNSIRKEANAMVAKFYKREKYLKDIEKLMKENELKIDDARTSQKLQKLKNFKRIDDTIKYVNDQDTNRIKILVDYVVELLPVPLP